MSTGLVWFRRDLRLADNPALLAALERHDEIICVYIHAPEEEAPWQPGAASRWWLHHSLTVLDQDLRERGANLIVLAGESLPSLQALVKTYKVDAIYWNRLYEPAAIKRDKKIKSALSDAGTTTESFNGSLLFEPWQVETGQGDPYRVFTPFWRNIRARLHPQEPLPAPKKIATPPIKNQITIADLDLKPSIGWDKEFHSAWRPGEAGAMESLADFQSSAIADYPTDRDRPDRLGTSRLSPHLHFGEISAKQVAWALQNGDRRADVEKGSESYLREIGWREFSQHLLYHFPTMPKQNLNPRFDAFHWDRRDASALKRWQQGRTGIPMVDAGMRELWATGWMHNRVRMLVASFLTKNLRQHWHHGERWFWDTLVDADLANNSQGWQWTAGCGVDASPYFRIFNPVTQGEKFDPQGSYVRRWIPELKDVPAPLVHRPWDDPGLLKRTGYPAPMVDLKASRENALVAYQATK
ncbi:MAG: deoxyribodipyrimidine photo-lyase [Dokdonella sp.]